MRFAEKQNHVTLPKAFKAGGAMRTAPSTFQQSHHKSLDQNRTWRQTFANHIQNEKPIKPETYVKSVKLWLPAVPGSIPCKKEIPDLFGTHTLSPNNQQGWFPFRPLFISASQS